MKIFIEGSPLFVQRSGVGQYTKRLLDATIAKDSIDLFTVFGFLLIGKARPQNLLKPAKNLDFCYIRYLPGKVYRGLFQYLAAPPVDLLLGARPDIVIFPNFVRWPLALPSKSIVIVYDLSYLLHPEHSAERLRQYLTKHVPTSIAKADHIITISENSRREIIEYYHVEPSKISIVHPAINHAEYHPRTSQEISAIKDKFKLNRDYILYTGTIEPRKNILGILDAYAKLPAAMQKKYQLVLAGGKGWLDERIKTRLDELAKLEIMTTGYVADEDLPALYSGASLFVYPSFYEGFGMPPLEAMACGVPAITSNNSSLPEVAGDAGRMINADDSGELSEAIQTVLGDSKLAETMRQAGYKQAARFTWEQSADDLLRVLRNV